MRQLAIFLFAVSMIACSDGGGDAEPPTACTGEGSCSADAPHCLDGACVACIVDGDCAGEGEGACVQNRCTAGTAAFTIGGGVEKEGDVWVVDFGGVAFGRSRVIKVRVENTGATALRLEHDKSVPGFEVPSQGTLDVPAGGFRMLEISFAPTVAGPVEATLVLRSGEVSADVRLQGLGVQPALVCSAEVLDFGTVLLRRSATRAISCRNETSAGFPVRVEVDRPFVRSGGTRDAAELPAGGLIDLTIELPGQTIPLIAGRKLRLLGPDGLPAAEVELVVDNILAWDVVEGVRSIDFGDVLPGTPAVRTLQIVNRSDVQIPFEFALDGDAVFSIDPAGGFMLQVDDPSTEGDESIATLSFAFAPPDLDRYSGRLIVLTPEGNMHLSMVGRGRGPGVHCYATPASLGRTAVGIPLTYPLICRNAGVAGSDPSLSLLTIESVRVDGHGWSAAVSGGINPAGYAVGAQFEVELTFDPAVGGTIPGTLVITSNDPLEPEMEIEIAAEAVDLPACNVQLLPPALDFGSLEPGTPIALSVIASNPDPHECLLHEISLAPGSTGFEVTSHSRLWLAGGEKYQITVLYTGGAGSYSGTLRLLASNQADPERLVPLSAFGREGCLQPVSLFNDWGAVEVGCRPPIRQVGFTNVCQNVINLISAQIVDGLNSFHIHSGPPLPTTLAPGAQFQLGVSFDASPPTEFLWQRWEAGALLVQTSEAPAPYFASLEGVGYPESHAFGRHDVFENEGLGRRLSPSILPRDNDGDGVVTEGDLRVYADHRQLMPTDTAGAVVWFWNAAEGAVEFPEDTWPEDARSFRLDYDHVCL